MIDNQELTEKELLPCRKCGKLDYDFWDGKGTQAYLSCNECGQEEGIQVTDLYDNVNEWPKFCQRTISYPLPAINKANSALIIEWNKRAESKQLTTTQQALDSALATIKELEVSEDKLIGERDLAEDALGDIAHIFDREFSNLYDFNDVINNVHNLSVDVTKAQAVQQALDSAVEALKHIAGYKECIEDWQNITGVEAVFLFELAKEALASISGKEAE